MDKINNYLLRLAILAAIFILVFTIPGTVLALEGDSSGGITLEVIGSGSAPVKGKISNARKTALLLAKRNAAEKGLGAAVSVEMLPNRREVISSVEGSISYNIMEEGQAGDLYNVTILAKLAIPAELMDSYGLSDDERETWTGYKPLVEKFPGGEINWQEGYILAYGTGKRPDKTRESNAGLLARRAAVVDAQARALEIINGIRVDAESQVKSLFDEDSSLFYRIEGLVRDATVVDETKGDPYSVTLKVPITGVKGLSLIFYKRMLKQRELPPPTGEKSASSQYTGLVIDARGTGIQTAMFPSVVTNNGDEIYSVASVDSDAFIRRGVAGYALAEMDVNEESVGENPLVIRVASLDERSVLTLHTANSLLIAQDTREKKRRTKRQGHAPLKLKGLGSGGKLRANLVISDSDAAIISASGEFSQLFKESRVVILTDPQIGGTEGHELKEFRPMASISGIERSHE